MKLLIFDSFRGQKTHIFQPNIYLAFFFPGSLNLAFYFLLSRKFWIVNFQNWIISHTYMHILISMFVIIANHLFILNVIYSILTTIIHSLYCLLNFFSELELLYKHIYVRSWELVSL